VYAQTELEDVEATIRYYVREMKSPDGEGSYLDLDPPKNETDQTATCTGCAGDESFIFRSTTREPLQEALQILESSGTSRFYVKSWNNLPAEDTRGIVTVFVDDAPIATGSAVYNVNGGAIVQFDVPLAVDMVRIPVGSHLTMQIELKSDICDCYSPTAYLRGVSPEHMFWFAIAADVVAEGAENLTWSANETQARVVAGDPVAYETMLAYNATNESSPANVTFNSTGLPDSYEVTFAPENASLEPGDALSITVHVQTPRDAPAQNHTFTVQAHGERGGNTTLNLTLEVVAMADGNPNGTTPHPRNTTTSAQPNSTRAGANAEGEGTPGLALAPIALTLFVGALWMRRRRAG
jgi:hypothetical protein